MKQNKYESLYLESNRQTPIARETTLSDNTLSDNTLSDNASCENELEVVCQEIKQGLTLRSKDLEEILSEWLKLSQVVSDDLSNKDVEKNSSLFSGSPLNNATKKSLLDVQNLSKISSECVCNFFRVEELDSIFSFEAPNSERNFLSSHRIYLKTHSMMRDVLKMNGTSSSSFLNGSCRTNGGLGFDPLPFFSNDRFSKNRIPTNPRKLGLNRSNPNNNYPTLNLYGTLLVSHGKTKMKKKKVTTEESRDALSKEDVLDLLEESKMGFDLDWIQVGEEELKIRIDVTSKKKKKKKKKKEEESSSLKTENVIDDIRAHLNENTRETRKAIESLEKKNHSDLVNLLLIQLMMEKITKKDEPMSTVVQELYFQKITEKISEWRQQNGLNAKEEEEETQVRKKTTQTAKSYFEKSSFEKSTLSESASFRLRHQEEKRRSGRLLVKEIFLFGLALTSVTFFGYYLSQKINVDRDQTMDYIEHAKNLVENVSNKLKNSVEKELLDLVQGRVKSIDKLSTKTNYLLETIAYIKSETTTNAANSALGNRGGDDDLFVPFLAPFSNSTTELALSAAEVSSTSSPKEKLESLVKTAEFILRMDLISKFAKEMTDFIVGGRFFGGSMLKSLVNPSWGGGNNNNENQSEKGVFSSIQTAFNLGSTLWKSYQITSILGYFSFIPVTSMVAGGLLNKFVEFVLPKLRGFETYLSDSIERLRRSIQKNKHHTNPKVNIFFFFFFPPPALEKKKKRTQFRS